MTAMDCAGLDRWLDEGRPRDGLAAAAVAHAASCARCTAALASFDALERALRAPPPQRAPPGLAAAVMAAVAAEPHRPRAARARHFPLVAWALGGTGFGLAAWGATALAARSPAAASGTLASLDLGLGQALGAAGSALPTAAQAGVALCFAAAATWAALLLARGAEALALGRRR